MKPDFDIEFCLFLTLLLLPISIGCFFFGWNEVEKSKKPKVIILHITKDEAPAFKIDERDWHEIIDSADEVT